MTDIKIHLHRIRRIAERRAAKSGGRISPDDLYSAGLEGYAQAYASFDPDRGTSLWRWASIRVVGAMADEQRRSAMVGYYRSDIRGGGDRCIEPRESH